MKKIIFVWSLFFAKIAVSRAAAERADRRRHHHRQDTGPRDRRRSMEHAATTMWAEQLRAAAGYNHCSIDSQDRYRASDQFCRETGPSSCGNLSLRSSDQAGFHEHRLLIRNA